jgi:hypothetical protein
VIKKNYKKKKKKFFFEFYEKFPFILKIFIDYIKKKKNINHNYLIAYKKEKFFFFITKLKNFLDKKKLFVIKDLTLKKNFDNN